MNIINNHSFIILVFGIILDLLFGDPVYTFHPVRVIGKTIYFFEKKLLKDSHSHILQFLFGILIFFIVIISFAMLYILICFFLVEKFRFVIDIFLFYSFIALKDLLFHVKKVVNNLKNNSIEKARKELSKIVGRKTENLDKCSILRGCAETISENYIDGIFAPLTYYFLGAYFFNGDIFSYGILFMMFYKITNTFDSIIGYKNKKYEYFGKFSAIMDDLLNFIPARLGVLSLFLCSLFHVKKAFKGLIVFLKDRKKHNSPNSACPMSYCAGFLNVFLGGDVEYHYGISRKSRINECGKDIEIVHIDILIFIIFCSSIATVFTYSILLLLKGV